MTSPRRLAAIPLAIMLTTADVSEAQSVVRDTSCSYERCAVWLDRTALREGQASAVVLRDGFLRAMRLAAFIGGSDSATVWAIRFEERGSTGNTLSAIGLVAMGVGSGAQYLRLRKRSPGTIDDANGLEASLILGGAISFFGGRFVRASAEPHRGRAIWWYNRRFAEPSRR